MGTKRSRPPRRKCQFPGCKAKTRLEWHHVKPLVEGGTDEDGLVVYCRKHHVAMHCAENFWAREGRKGGSKTAQKTDEHGEPLWKRNLVQFRNKGGQGADQHRAER